MSLKAELDTWVAALEAYDKQDFEKALQLFNKIADTSKILTNIGLIYATLGEHEAAVENFNAATSLDQYLAVAYFQCGVSNFLLQRYDLAVKDFEEALLYLRGNQNIDYHQLGLKFRLYSAEVLFNKGLCHVYLGETDIGLQDMQEARTNKATAEHNVIDDAIQDRGEGYTVFSIPVGVVYRPSDAKVKNAKTKDYLGKAKLVAAADEKDAYVAFTGAERLRRGMNPNGILLDQPPPEPAVSMPRPNPAPQRNPTTIRNDRGPGPGPGPGPAPSMPSGPTRGLSIRSPSSDPGSGPAPRPRVPPSDRPPLPIEKPAPRVPSPPAADRAPKAPNPARATEFYDDYLDAYGNDEPPLPDDTKRVQAWATKTTPGAPPSRAPSNARLPPSSYAPSSAGTMRRRPTRRNTTRRVQSQYEEEEGYVSGDYEDAPFELIKIRVKLHFRDDVRGMAIVPDMPWEEFLDRVCAKFDKAYGSLEMKFKDEDGVMVTMKDDSDYELAIETAREAAKGRPEGKLEVWCQE